MIERIELKRPFENAAGDQQSYVNMETQVLLGHFRAARRACSAARDPEDMTFQLLCQLCGLEEEQLAQFCMADFNALAEKVDFGTPSEEEGKTPDPKE